MDNEDVFDTDLAMANLSEIGVKAKVSHARTHIFALVRGMVWSNVTNSALPLYILCFAQ